MLSACSGMVGREYDNGCRDARVAESNAFLQEGNAECGRAALNGCSGSGYEAMAVGIGFDNGHDLRFWRDELSDCGNICSQWPIDLLQSMRVGRVGAFSGVPQSAILYRDIW